MVLIYWLEIWLPCKMWKTNTNKNQFLYHVKFEIINYKSFQGGIFIVYIYIFQKFKHFRFIVSMKCWLPKACITIDFLKRILKVLWRRPASSYTQTFYNCRNLTGWLGMVDNTGIIWDCQFLCRIQWKVIICNWAWAT